jgi:hypothetical protein
MVKSRRASTSERVEPAAIPTDGIDFQSKLMAILSNAVDALSGNAGIIALWNEREKRFVEGASYGLEPRVVDRLRPLLREAIPDLATSEQSFDRLSQLAPDLHVSATTTEQVQDPCRLRSQERRSD